MREPQEVEGFRFGLITLGSPLGRIAAELDHARFLRVQSQTKLRKASLQLVMEPPRFGFVLESHDEVIRVADDHDVTFGILLSPLVRP